MSTETITPRLLVPYDEARRLLGGIGRTKFYELIEDEALVRVSIGRRGFITAESLTRFVESLTEPTDGDSPPPQEAANRMGATTTPASPRGPSCADDVNHSANRNG